MLICDTNIRTRFWEKYRRLQLQVTVWPRLLKNPSVQWMYLFKKNKLQKESVNPQKQLKSVLQAYSVNMLVVRANRGVRTTYLSCSCDISVGRTGLSSWYWKSDPSSLPPWKTPLLTLDKGHGNKQGVPSWENGFCRLFSLFGAMLRN